MCSCFCVCPPQHLRQELELKFYEDRFDWDQVRQNDAAGLLKMFIRELPYPLLTQQHLPAFTAAQSESEHTCPRLFTGFPYKVENLTYARNLKYRIKHLQIGTVSIQQVKSYVSIHKFTYFYAHFGISHKKNTGWKCQDAHQFKKCG